MKTIWKFILNVTDLQTLKIPKGSKFLSLGVQDGSICIWFIVDSSEQTIERDFEMFGTGENFDADMMHSVFLGTVQIGRLVWHVFEKTKN